MSERAGFLTVKTMVDPRNAEMLLGELTGMLKDPSNPHELFYGYAGLLYLIRLVEDWVSSHLSSRLPHRLTCFSNQTFVLFSPTSRRKLQPASSPPVQIGPGMGSGISVLPTAILES